MDYAPLVFGCQSRSNSLRELQTAIRLVWHHWRFPIVAHDLDTDPVASGLIASLAHPGANITGFFFGFPEFRMKWVELLKDYSKSHQSRGLIGPSHGTLAIEPR